MERYVCTICDYVYDPAMGDPDNGIAPGTRFEDLPTIGSASLRRAQKRVCEGTALTTAGGTHVR